MRLQRLGIEAGTDTLPSVRDRGNSHDNTLNSLWYGKGRELNQTALKVAMKLAA